MNKGICVFAALLFCGCGSNDPKPEPPANSSKTTSGSAVSSTQTAATPPASSAPPKVSPFDEMLSKKTFAEAIAFAKPQMKDVDKSGDKNPGSLLLSAWGLKNGFKWAEIQALPETTHAKILKDPDEERGKRYCAAGSIIEITVDKSDLGKGYPGGMFDSANNVVRFYAIGSTGELVARKLAKFCGVVTGKESYSNSGGGVTHAIKVVGMFDLPENTKPAASAK